MKQVVHTAKAPAAVGCYSQAIRVGDFLFTSGQVGFVPETGLLVEGGVSAQARQALENIKTIIEAAGACMDDVVKTTVFLTDISDFGAVNEVYGQFFQVAPPARSCFAVAALPKGALVEIETIVDMQGK